MINAQQLSSIKRDKESITIIVPAYKGLNETRRCIESVLGSHSKCPYDLVVIDDASPDPDLVAYLRSLRTRDNITLIVNDTNQGFVRSANRGMSINTESDVVLLNSDTEVANDWLDRLRSAAYAQERSGTVTPFSNNADLCSTPVFCKSNALPEGLSVSTIDEAYSISNRKAVVSLPTACGFCMYIRRDCLRDVGLFDEAAFGRGYGEENDFCLRATRKLWHHVLACDVFVYHQGEVSFRGTTVAAKDRAIKVIRKRYRHYERLIQDYIVLDPARIHRMAGELALSNRLGAPVILFICHALGGGTLRHAVDLASFLSKKAEVLFLLPDGNSGVSLSNFHDSNSKPVFFKAAECNALVKLLDSCQISRIHIHQISGYPHGFIQKLVFDLSVPFDFTIHDYYSLCPFTTLSDSDGCYCGEPCVRNGLCVRDQPIPAGTPASWKAQHEWLLKEADRLIAPSIDVSTRLRKHGVRREISVVPHILHSHHSTFKCSKLAKGEPVKILVLGAFSRIKGALSCLDLAKHAAAYNLPLRFHILGSVEPNLKQSFPTLIYHGPYREEDLENLLIEISPHMAWFPAQVPETFSYTLSAAIAHGLPIVASDLGAFPERLVNRTQTWISPWQSSTLEWAKQFMAIYKTLCSPGTLTTPLCPTTQVPEFYKNDYIMPYLHDDSSPAAPTSGRVLSVRHSSLIARNYFTLPPTPAFTPVRYSILTQIRHMNRTGIGSILISLFPRKVRQTVRRWLRADY